MAPVEYDTMIADYQSTGDEVVAPRHGHDRRRRRRARRRAAQGQLDADRAPVRRPRQPTRAAVIASLGKLTRDEPQKMPLLLRFDEFVPGQRYQGVNELALRTAGGFGGDSTQLTELVANRLTKEYGGPYLRTAAAGMSFNQSSEGFYLLVEHPTTTGLGGCCPARSTPPSTRRSSARASGTRVRIPRATRRCSTSRPRRATSGRAR